jgi:hypothetical protein
MIIAPAQFVCWAKKNGLADKFSSTSTSGSRSDADTTTRRNAKVIATPPTAIVPDDRFICPLTKDLMKEPMMSRHGHNFERYIILSKIQLNGFVCPISGKPLRPSDLVSNRKLQTEIQQWQQQQQQQQQHQECAAPSSTQMKFKLLVKGKLAVVEEEEEEKGGHGQQQQHSTAVNIIRVLAAEEGGKKRNGLVLLGGDDEAASRAESDPNVLSCIDEIIGIVIEYDDHAYEQ